MEKVWVQKEEERQALIENELILKEAKEINLRAKQHIEEAKDAALTAIKTPNTKQRALDNASEILKDVDEFLGLEEAK